MKKIEIFISASLAMKLREYTVILETLQQLAIRRKPLSKFVVIVIV